MRKDLIGGQYLASLNDVLKTSSAEGAYAIGVVSVLAWKRGLDPTRELIEAARDCRRVSEAGRVFEAWWRGRRRRPSE